MHRAHQHTGDGSFPFAALTASNEFEDLRASRAAVGPVRSIGGPSLIRRQARRRFDGRLQMPSSSRCR
jgi:hypothetical protein